MFNFKIAISYSRDIKMNVENHKHEISIIKNYILVITVH